MQNAGLGELQAGIKTARRNINNFRYADDGRASLVALMVKNLPAMQDTQVQFLGREDPLEKGVATHSSILAWRIPWIEEPGGYSPLGHKQVGMTEQLSSGVPMPPPLWQKAKRN